MMTGIDGKQGVSVLKADGCCPPSLCQLDRAGLICNFVNQLPRGPLWDKAKFEAPQRYDANGETIALANRPSSMADHAIYTAQRLIAVLFDAVWPSLRESNPATAYDTLDDWLLRLGWSDCFDCACRDPSSELTPIEVIAPGRAVKHGIVLALTRLSNGIIFNLDAINFVIAPLGAKVEPKCWRYIELDPRRCNLDDGTTGVDCATEQPIEVCQSTATVDPWQCVEAAETCPGTMTLGSDCRLKMKQFEFKIVPASDTLPAHNLAECPRVTPMQPPGSNINACSPAEACAVTAYYDRKPTDDAGLPAKLWPGVMAAECIVRSMVPSGARILISRGY
jgi:hypothetical protein